MAAIGAVPVRLSFVLDAYSLPAATLVTLIAWMALRFSATYLHRESGFARFFLGMCLFLAGMLLIVLAGNAVLTFVGWELAGFSSWLLIGYAWERPLATGNALFVFLTNRIGDAGFMLGIGLRGVVGGHLEWAGLPADGSLGRSARACWRSVSSWRRWSSRRSCRLRPGSRARSKARRRRRRSSTVR
jgi:NADH:ubiquinone oxidoreductase subunit 5 (subunit L)/multisubunit Na+/H+ antiporter MnhA subunit